MANNKIQLANGTILLDLTADSVTADKMVQGITAHAANGNQITGTMVVHNYRTGHGNPPSDLAEGDLYFDLG